MHVHSNATTNKKQRERLSRSTKTCRALAEEMAISLGTVHRWKQRDSPQDKSCRPNKIEYAFDPSEQAMILSLRQKGLPLDDLVDLVQQPLPEARRSSIYRLLKRNGVSRLPKKRSKRQAKTTNTASSRTTTPASFTSTASICPNSKVRSATASSPLTVPLVCRSFGSMSTRTRRRPPTF